MCQHFDFVVRGCLRWYMVDNDGVHHSTPKHQSSQNSVTLPLTDLKNAGYYYDYSTAITRLF